MTSKVAKCERIFNEGYIGLKLVIDYEAKNYFLESAGSRWDFRLVRNTSEITDDLGRIDLMRQAIEFAEKELTEKPQEEDVHIRRLTPTECEIQTEEEDKEEKDKPQEKVKHRADLGMTKGDLLAGYTIYPRSIPDSASVIFEWEE